MKKIFFALLFLTVAWTATAQEDKFFSSIPVVGSALDSLYLLTTQDGVWKKFDIATLKIVTNLRVRNSPILYTPTLSGNTNNLNEIVTDPNGNIWIIDYTGNAVMIDEVIDGSETNITGGTNVSISGSGTALDPFVISASGGDKTASEVNITDLGENYTGTTVEDALSEIADSILQHSIDINAGVGGLSDYIKVATTAELVGKTAAVGDYIYNYETGATYKVQADSIAGYEVDSIAVAPVSGGYAVIKPQAGKFYASYWGISSSNDTTTNYNLFQNAIKYSSGNTFVSDIDSFAITISGGSVLIEENIFIDFQNNKLKIFPDAAEDWNNDAFSVVPVNDVTSVTISNINIIGASGRGFNLDGTKDTGTLNESALLDSGGTTDKELNITLENFSLTDGFVPYGVQFNGAPGTIKWLGGKINVSSTDGLGVFGVGMTAIVENVDFYKCGYEASEVLGTQTYGVAVYFHPYVTYSLEGCRFFDQPRAFQCSSGSAYYETTWDYDVTPTDYQIIAKCYFDSTITEKAVVNSWYYPYGVIEDCIFNNSGNAIALVNSLKVERCFFSDNNAVSIISSYPPLNRDEVHNYNFTDCEFRGTGVATLTDDSGTSPIRGQYNFNNCKFFSTSGGFNLSGLDFAQDSARININIDRSYITNISNTSFFNFPSMADISIKNSILEGKTGRMFVIYPTAGTENYNGRFEIKNSRFINKNVGNPLWFYSGGSSYVGELRDQDFVIKDCRFPTGQIYIGYSYNATQKFFGVPLQDGLNPDTITTNYIPLDLNYNEYIVSGGIITSAYLQISTNTGAGGIQDPFRLLKGSFWVIGGEGGATITNSDNINTITGDDIIIEENERVEFRLNRITQEWDQVETPGKFTECTIIGSIYLNAAKTLGIFTGTGSPEGVISADVGSTFHRTDGGTSTTLYVKESGSGNTGWVAK
jgi:hypothetical protein